MGAEIVAIFGPVARDQAREEITVSASNGELRVPLRLFLRGTLKLVDYEMALEQVDFGGFWVCEDDDEDFCWVGLGVVKHRVGCREAMHFFTELAEAFRPPDFI